MRVSADSANIARHLPLMAARQPSRPAVKVPRGRTPAGEIDYLTLTFAELDSEVDAWCAQLLARGVRPGDRALVMVRQGLPLIAAAFALFKLGAVPVVIDPGMGLRSFLACVARSRPRILLGIPFARFVSRVFRPAFRSVEVRVPVAGSMVARQAMIPEGGYRRPERSSEPSAPLFGVRIPVSGARFPPSGIANSAPTDLAAVLFTSGSTGAPKGVCYEHGMFDAQVRLVRETYGIEPGEVDLPLLPLFALFGPALGMTTVVAELDPSRPAAADPEKIVRAIRQEGVTNSFGSPTLWSKVADYCLAHRLTLPSLRRVLCAGAPVPASLWTKAPQFIPGGRLHSPYGATEVLPVSTVTADEIDAASTRGACVGHPLPENRVKIIAIDDRPLASLADARELQAGEIGEIIVSGPTVTKEYDQLQEATRQAKIQIPNPKSQVPNSKSQGSAAPKEFLGTCALEPGTSAPPGAVWHRMGDAGYCDANGRLWFCGRVVERVETADGPMFTEPCEQVFRAHPLVVRCALIGLGARGRQMPAIVIEPKPGASPRSAESRREWARSLGELARGHSHTAAIRRFYFYPHLPVDVRHNAKIHRLALATWAATADVLEVTGDK
jgi:acyl-CoA synthetase (AMP-forming)/AMP-acid ligase II